MANKRGESETMTDFIFLGFKITVDSDCSHEIKTLASSTVLRLEPSELPTAVFSNTVLRLEPSELPTAVFSNTVLRLEPSELRHLLHGRKAMIKLDSVLRSRDITLPTKVCLVKSMAFTVWFLQ